MNGPFTAGQAHKPPSKPRPVQKRLRQQPRDTPPARPGQPALGTAGTAGCALPGPGHRPHGSLRTWQQLNRRQWPLKGHLCFSCSSKRRAGSFPKAMLRVLIWRLCKYIGPRKLTGFYECRSCNFFSLNPGLGSSWHSIRLLCSLPCPWSGQISAAQEKVSVEFQSFIHIDWGTSVPCAPVPCFHA